MGDDLVRRSLQKAESPQKTALQDGIAIENGLQDHWRRRKQPCGSTGIVGDDLREKHRYIIHQ